MWIGSAICEPLTGIGKVSEAVGGVNESDVTLALDCAASEFYRDGRYVLAGEDKSFEAPAFADYLASLCDKYPILSIEDGMDENDWEGWAALTAAIGDRCQIVGDELPPEAETDRRGLQARGTHSVLCIPIVSGNVSLYNETDGKGILPTPTIGAVGLVASLGILTLALLLFR